MSERFPSVKVIRLAPQKGIGYLYAAESEDGLEEAALYQFRALLLKSKLDVSQMRLFGWNVNLESPSNAVTKWLLFVKVSAMLNTRAYSLLD